MKSLKEYLISESAESLDNRIEKLLKILTDEDRKTFMDSIENNKVYERSFLNDDELDYYSDFSLKFKSLDADRSIMEKFKIDDMGWIDGGNGLNTLFFEQFNGKHVYLFILSSKLGLIDDYKETLLKEGLKESEISLYDIID